MEERLQNTTWEPLCGGARVLVSPQHTFGTDAVLLAHFAAPPTQGALGGLGHRLRGDSPAVAGAHPGGGHHRGGDAGEGRLAGPALGGGKRLFRHGGHCAGGRPAAWGTVPGGGVWTASPCNPPYTAPGAGIPSEDGARRAARQGDSLSLEDVARGARYALRFGGRLCLCLRPQRLAEAVEVFHSHQLEPKRLRLVQQRAGKAPFLFLLECRRGGKPGMEVGPVLLLEREDGSPTQEIEAILRRLPGQPGAQKTVRGKGNGTGFGAGRPVRGGHPHWQPGGFLPPGPGDAGGGGLYRRGGPPGSPCGC